MSEYGGAAANPAYADAIQRARQIAAKLRSTAGESGTKRTLEDHDADGPEKKKLAVGQDNIVSQITAMQAQRAAVATALTVEDWKVPDQMVGLIIGRGGEQITRLQAESGCKVQMAADGGGLPERVCTLTGSRQAIEKAKELMSQIIGRGGPSLPVVDTSYVPDRHDVVEMMIPGSKVGLVIGKGGETIRNLQERSGVRMVLVQSGKEETSSEKPLRINGEPDKCEYAKQLVMDLIREKEFESMQRGSSGGTGGESHEIMVPKQAVGVVIGKGGDTIKRIQHSSGAKVQFLNVKEEGPGDKTCIITGSPEQIQAAANFINDLIQSIMVRDHQNGGRGRGRSDVPEVHYAVPTNKCGLVIGKGGETIKDITQQSGAYVTLSALPSPNPQEKIFIIKGQLPQIEHAKDMISERIGVVGTVIQTQNQPQVQQQQFQQEAAPQQFLTPQDWTNVYQPWQAQGIPATDPNAAAWAAYYSQYYGQQQAQQMQAPQSAQSNMLSQPNQNPGQPQTLSGAVVTNYAATPGSATQPDYSSAWAEYYRAMGMFREAEMMENRARAHAQMTAVVPQSGQAFAQQTPATTASGTAPVPTGVPAPGQPQQEFPAGGSQDPWPGQTMYPQQFGQQQQQPPNAYPEYDFPPYDQQPFTPDAPQQ